MIYINYFSAMNVVTLHVLKVPHHALGCFRNSIPSFVLGSFWGKRLTNRRRIKSNRALVPAAIQPPFHEWFVWRNASVFSYAMDGVVKRWRDCTVACSRAVHCEIRISQKLAEYNLKISYKVVIIQESTFFKGILYIQTTEYDYRFERK